MNTNILSNSFGYSEMYEWTNLPNNKFGRFVQFSNEAEKTHEIEYATSLNDIIGVSTINSSYISDNPDEWFLKYAFDEYGDIYVNKKDVAIGKKTYDNINEIKFIKTEKKTIYEPIISDMYNKDLEYIDRISRQEWVRVNIIGKCIVEDDGKCVPGEYCTLYNGNDNTRFGTAIPCKDNRQKCWRVLNRVSDKTILIFYK